MSRSLAHHLTPEHIIPAHRLELPVSEDSIQDLARAKGVEKERSAREAEALLPEALDPERH